MSDKTIVYPMQATPGAVVYHPPDNLDTNTWFLEKLRQRAETAEARVAEYERILADPAAVWANMLTGKIARPLALEHYEQCKARVEELEAEQSATANHVLVEDARHDALLKAEAENAMLRRELSLISHLHPVPGEPGSIARRALAATEPK